LFYCHYTNNLLTTNLLRVVTTNYRVTINGYYLNDSDMTNEQALDGSCNLY
jgi:hypothetical protein